MAKLPISEVIHKLPQNTLDALHYIFTHNLSDDFEVDLETKKIYVAEEKANAPLANLTFVPSALSLSADNLANWQPYQIVGTDYFVLKYVPSAAGETTPEPTIDVAPNVIEWDGTISTDSRSGRVTLRNTGSRTSAPLCLIVNSPRVERFDFYFENQSENVSADSEDGILLPSLAPGQSMVVDIEGKGNGDTRAAEATITLKATADTDTISPKESIAFALPREI